MKIVRSILGVVVGVILAMVVIQGIEIINFFTCRPDNGKSVEEQMKEIQENPKVVKAFMEALPTSALVMVVVGWQIGAFLGGAVSALIAGRGRLLHAGIIGGL